MIIAAAQTIPFYTDPDYNRIVHEQMIRKAADQHAKLLLFPEMSLTGYQREHARQFSFEPMDSRLRVFKQLAQKHQMTLVLGAPVLLNQQLYIGSIILQPGGSELIYTKQWLHPGEETWFKSGNLLNPILQAGELTGSVAICADIGHPAHAGIAATRKTDLYLASLFYTTAAIGEAHAQLGGYARQHRFTVLMANYARTTGEPVAGGMSAAWNAEGKLVGELGEEEGLLVVRCGV